MLSKSGLTIYEAAKIHSLEDVEGRLQLLRPEIEEYMAKLAPLETELGFLLALRGDLRKQKNEKSNFDSTHVIEDWDDE